MPKVSRSRRWYYDQQQQLHHPIFCSTMEVQMPHLMNELLHNQDPAKPSTRAHHFPHTSNNNELNANLEQILRAYLAQFWRHSIEKELGSCRLWDEITGCTPRPRPAPQYPTLLRSRLPSPRHEESQWWWRQPPFALDDIPLTPSPDHALTPSPSSTPATSACSSLSNTPNTTPNSASSPDASPGASPHTASPDNGGVVARSDKTRWQLYAERLFAHLLRLPRFSLHQHMQSLIRVYHHSNLRKDAQLVDIVRNYLATVL